MIIQNVYLIGVKFAMLKTDICSFLYQI